MPIGVLSSYPSKKASILSVVVHNTLIIKRNALFSAYFKLTLQKI